MKNSILFHIIIIILITLISCSQDQEKVIDSPVLETLVIEQDTIEDLEKIDELYIVEGKSVIFFVLSKPELKKLTKDLGSAYRYETDYLFNNFTRQAKNFNKILAKHNIHSELISSKRILVKLNNGQTVSFNRVKEDQIMGEIISDGVQNPVIEFGMFSNKELIALINKYFQIESLDIEEENKPVQLPDEEIMIADSIDQMKE